MNRCDDCGDWVRNVTITRIPFGAAGRLCDWHLCAHCLDLRAKDDARTHTLCPRCQREYPYGDPRSVIVPPRQCFDCDERDARATRTHRGVDWSKVPEVMSPNEYTIRDED